MNIFKELDKRTDDLLSKIGIEDKNTQDIVQVGALAVVAAIIYKMWRKK